MAEETKEKKETSGKKSLKDLFAGSPIDSLINGRPWIVFAVIGVIVVLLVVLVIAGMAGRNKSSGSLTTVSHGVFTAAIVYGDDRYAEHDEGGHLVGVEPDLARSLAETEGLELQLREAATITEALTLIDNGTVDAAFGRISDSMNLTGYTLSQQYDHCGLFMVTALHDYTDSLDLMTGYSVGVLDDIKKTAEGISGYEFISPRDYADAVTMGQDIRDRAVNMGICSERDAIELVRAFPNALQAQEIANGPMENYVAVFPKRSAGHATILNALLEQGIETAR